MGGQRTSERRTRTPPRKRGGAATPEGEDAQRLARERERLWNDIKEVPESRPPTKPP
jgi:hypothetical protein